jgi:hypothetical protein
LKLKAFSAGLLVSCGALAWLCLTLFASPVAIPDIDPGPDWAPEATALVISDDPTGGVDPEILARLVFSPTRRLPQPRPPEPAPSQAEAQPAADAKPPIDAIAPPEGLVLQGIFIDHGRRSALLSSTNHPDGAWLKTGDEFDGWAISDIAAERIALKNGEREIALTLYVDNSGK